MAIHCSQCGTSVPDFETFCFKCGHQVREKEEPASWKYERKYRTQDEWRQLIGQDWLNIARRSEEVRVKLEEHKRRFACPISGCSNTSIGPYRYNLNSTTGDWNLPAFEGMSFCIVCRRYVCYKHHLDVMGEDGGHIGVGIDHIHVKRGSPFTGDNHDIKMLGRRRGQDWCEFDSTQPSGMCREIGIIVQHAIKGIDDLQVSLNQDQQQTYISGFIEGYKERRERDERSR